MFNVAEVLAESDKSWEEASLKAVKKARETVCGVKSVYIKNLEAQVENNQITAYQLNRKFELE